MSILKLLLKTDFWEGDKSKIPSDLKSQIFEATNKLLTEKYYTPSIEEFHVGFQCEARLKLKIGFAKGLTTDWTKGQFKSEYWHLIEQLEFRVKCLDREEIEAEGWEFLDHLGDDDFSTNDRFIYHVNDRTELIMHVIYNPHLVTIAFHLRSRSNGIGSVSFSGMIKNRSELHRIMKMIAIS